MPPMEQPKFSTGAVMCVLLLRIIAKRDSRPPMDAAHKCR